MTSPTLSAIFSYLLGDSNYHSGDSNWLLAKAQEVLARTASSAKMADFHCDIDTRCGSRVIGRQPRVCTEATGCSRRGLSWEWWHRVSSDDQDSAWTLQAEHHSNVHSCSFRWCDSAWVSTTSSIMGMQVEAWSENGGIRKFHSQKLKNYAERLVLVTRFLVR